MRALAAVGFVALAGGCDLGIDESQIGTTSDGGGPPISSSASGGPGSTASDSGASASSGPASTVSATTTTTTAASTSTGMALPQVACIDNMFAISQCAPGQVCCVAPTGSFGHCANGCVGSEVTFACDGPEDCPAGQDCCAPDEEDGDVGCVTSCSDDDTVCKGDGDCVDACSEEFSGPLGQVYQTCF